MSKIHTNPDHLRKSGNKLSDFGSKLASGGQKLESVGQNLVSHASGDKSGFGSVISKAMGKGVQITGKVFQEGGRVVEGAGNRLGKTADLHQGADEHGAGLLKKLHPDDEKFLREASLSPRNHDPELHATKDSFRSSNRRNYLHSTALTGGVAGQRA